MTRSTTARHQLLARSALCGVLSALIVGAAPALALDFTDVTNIQGSGPTSVMPSGGGTTVVLGATRTVIDWNNFDIGVGETVDFVFNDKNAIVLNRVNSATATSINGTLNGCLNSCGGAFTPGGSIWIYNSNGVLFGANARVNVGNLLVTTSALDRATDNTPGGFLDDSAYNFSFTGAPGGANGIVVGFGAQFRTAGSLALIAPFVNTQAFSVIDATNGDVLYGAADSYTVKFAPDADGDMDLINFNVAAGGGTSVANALDLQSATTGGRVFASVVSKTGVISSIVAPAAITANAVSGSNGDIVLSAGGGILNGRADTAAGGSVSLEVGALTAKGDVTLAASGAITLTDDITLTGETFRALTMSSGDAINQAGGIITASMVSTMTANGVSLGRANLISTLGSAQNTSTGAVTINNAKAMNSGFISNTGSGDTTITTTAGLLTLNSNISANGRLVLNGYGGVTAGYLSSATGIDVTAATGDTLVQNASSAGQIRVTATAGNATLRSATLSGTASGIDVVATGNATLGADSMFDYKADLTVNRTSGVGSINVTSSAGDARVFMGTINTGLSLVDGGPAGTVWIGMDGSFSADTVRGFNVTLSGGATVGVTSVTVEGGDYRLMGRGFTGSVLTPTGPIRDLSIFDWGGNLVLAGDLTAQRHLKIETQSGGFTTTGTLTAGAGADPGDLTIISLGAIKVASVSASRDIYLGASGGNLDAASIQVGRNYYVVGDEILNGALAPTGARTGTANWVDRSGDFALGSTNLFYNGDVGVSASGALTGTGLISSGLGSVSIRASSINFNAVTAAQGDVSISAGTFTALTSVMAGRNMTLQSYNTLALGAATITVGQTLTLTADRQITQGAGVITAATLTGSSMGGTSLTGANKIGVLNDFRDSGGHIIPLTRGHLLINNAAPLTINQVVYGAGTIKIQTQGGLTIAATGGVHADGGGDAIVLASDGAFVNHAGSNALRTPGGGRWLVYSQAQGTPMGSTAGNSFGGLVGKSFYGSAYDFTSGAFASAPGAGNRFVYAYRPILTVAPVSQTLTYNGQIPTLTALITGLVNGDLAANAWSGAPVLSGATSKNVGTYGLTATLGTLLSEMGYGFTFAAGTLTIDPKAISGIVTAQNRTYDGGTTATGSISLSGAISGDDVVISATGYNFSDKNAGVGKTVTASGATLTGGDAGNYTLASVATTTADILRKTITGALTAGNKTYDGATSATGSITLAGTIAGDDIGAGGTYSFGDKNAGTGKTVTASGVALTGGDAGNYTLASVATTTADISKKVVTGQLTAYGKTYDGSTTASATISLTGMVSGDNLTAIGVYDFADKNAGAGKTVSASNVALGSADAGNYTLASVSTATADVSRRVVTGQLAINGKVYDGSSSATGTVNLSNVVLGDDLAAGGTYSFADKNAATGKTVTASGVTLTGVDAGNYTLAPVATTTADISRKAITGALTAGNKTYDGGASATGSITLVGTITGDDIGAGGTYSFADKNAGVGKTVTASGVTLTGGDAGNYTLAPVATTTADISRKTITGALVASNKTYDGGASATGSITLAGTITGDDIGAGGTYSFADKNAGAGKTVSASGAALTGGDAGNYTLASVATGSADISRKTITGTITAQGKTYDGSTATTGSVTLVGVIAGDTVSANGGSYSFADANAGLAKTVTVSGIVFGGADAGNYSLSLPTAGVADILRRAVAVTAHDQSKVFNQADPLLTYGIVSGSLVQGEGFSGGLVRASGEGLGTYVIGRGTLSLSRNYDLSFTPGTFKILEVPQYGQDSRDTLQSLNAPFGLTLDWAPSGDVQVDGTVTGCSDDKACQRISQGPASAGF